MRNLAEQSFWKECRSLLVYLAFGPELDTGGVVRSALELGIEVFSPCIRGDVMEFRRIGGLGDATGKGVLGIREPGENAAVWSLPEAPSPSLVLTPGLAFDTRGGRLGRGRGYYDRFIRRVRKEAGTAGVPCPLFIGYAYNGQIVPEVPVDGNDERLDGLVTDGFIGLF
jgi:5-formyltetrahydrofolate cyclo-ligase